MVENMLFRLETHESLSAAEQAWLVSMATSGLATITQQGVDLEYAEASRVRQILGPDDQQPITGQKCRKLLLAWLADLKD